MIDSDDHSTTKRHIPPVNLEILSIEELQLHIIQLEQEIKKTQQILEEKKKARGGAEAFFKK